MINNNNKNKTYLIRYKSGEEEPNEVLSDGGGGGEIERHVGSTPRNLDEDDGGIGFQVTNCKK